MDKDAIETMFRKAGLSPVSRETIGDYNLFIGDGFSRPPHSYFQRFDIEPDDFPEGMYVTFWWLGADERLLRGSPLFIKPTEDQLFKRINAARQDAMDSIAKFEKAKQKRRKH